MFCVNIVIGQQEFAILNIVSALLCWVPIIMNSSEEDENE